MLHDGIGFVPTLTSNAVVFVSRGGHQVQPFVPMVTGRREQPSSSPVLKFYSHLCIKRRAPQKNTLAKCSGSVWNSLNKSSSLQRGVMCPCPCDYVRPGQTHRAHGRAPAEWYMHILCSPQTHWDLQPPTIYYPEAVFLAALCCELARKSPSISVREP